MNQTIQSIKDHKLVSKIAELFISRQFFLFFCVGTFSAFINWTSREAFELLVTFEEALFIGYGFGVSTAFALNYLYVFPGSPKRIEAQIRDFLLINLAMMPVVVTVSLVLNKILSHSGIIHSQSIAHAIGVAVPMPLSFIFYKFLAFKQGKKGSLSKD